MADQLISPAFMVERVSTVVRTGLELAVRQTQAAQEFWAAVPLAREPKDLMALQADYWRRALDDYSAVMREAVSPPSLATTAPTSDAATKAARAA